MTKQTLSEAVSTGLISLILLLAVACANGDAGLSPAEVREIARGEADSALAAQPGLTAAEVEEIVQAAVAEPSQPGLTSAEVEEIVQAALAARPQVDPGLSGAEVQRIVGDSIADLPAPEPGLTHVEAEDIARHAVASIPPRSAPLDYTRFFVANAITRCEREGLEATLGYYNRAESVDGQWYLFIVDGDDRVIAHYDSGLLGEDLKGPIGTDANGYNFGPDMLSATGEGKWVSYVYWNPESGRLDSGSFELKNAWVVRHDGLLFASGWYIGADDFTKLLVSVAIDRFRSGGLEATVAYFAESESALAGLGAAIDYYNEAETVDGRWSAFIAADESGRIVAHSDPTVIGSDLQDLFGVNSTEATSEGSWVSTDSVRMWVAESGGFVFGSGWHHSKSGG